jgi:hypothetical protein
VRVALDEDGEDAGGASAEGAGTSAAKTLAPAHAAEE